VQALNRKMPAGNIKKILANDKFILIIILVVLCAFLSLTTDYFATSLNVTAILSQMSLNGVLAVGMTFCILIGGIDLSVGSMLSLSGVMVAICLRVNMNPVMACLVAVLVGAFCGLLNGLMVTFGRLPPFIATLGMLSIAQGTALILTSGRALFGMLGSIVPIGSGKLGIIPYIWIIMLVCFVVAYFILEHTRAGRYIYTIGGNAEAARLSGIRINVYKGLPFLISGITAGLAGVMMSARLNSAEPTVGSGMEMDAIAAVIIGGTSFTGGTGTISGTFIGALIMSVLRNGMIHMGVGSYPQQIVIGSIVVIMVMVDTLSKNK
jgi:ribose transport system permease protein